MYTPSLVLFAIFNLVLCGSGTRNPYQAQTKDTYAASPTDGDMARIDNRENKNKFVALSETQNNGESNPHTHSCSQTNPNNNVGNSFSISTYDANEPNPDQAYTINNIGNGYGNHNTVVTVTGDGTTAHRQSDDSGRSNKGTRFTTQSNNEVTIHNVGHGPGNQNRVIVQSARTTQTKSGGNTYQINTENTAGTGTHQLSTVESQLNELKKNSQELQANLQKVYNEVVQLYHKLSRCNDNKQ